LPASLCDFVAAAPELQAKSAALAVSATKDLVWSMSQNLNAHQSIEASKVFVSRAIGLARMCMVTAAISIATASVSVREA